MNLFEMHPGRSLSGTLDCVPGVFSRIVSDVLGQRSMLNLHPLTMITYPADCRVDLGVGAGVVLISNIDSDFELEGF